MEADLSVVCGPPFFPAPKESMASGFDAEYRVLTNLALAVLVLIIFGVPILYACLLIHARRQVKKDDNGVVVILEVAVNGRIEKYEKSRLDDKLFKQRFGTIYKSFDRDYIWFESVDLIRKFILTASFLAAPRARVLCCT